MTSDTHEPEFYVAPVIADSSGHSIVPNNAIARGSLSAVTGNIIDSQERKACEAVINDAAEALGTLKDIRAREDAVKRREDAVRSQLMQDFIGRLDALAQRIDSLEVEQAEQAKLAARDPDADYLPEPPSSLAPPAAADDGPLEAPTKAPEVEKFEPDPETPRSPVAAEDA